MSVEPGPLHQVVKSRLNKTENIISEALSQATGLVPWGQKRVELLGQGMSSKVEKITWRHINSNLIAARKEYMGEGAEGKVLKEFAIAKALQKRIPIKYQNHIIPNYIHTTRHDEQGDHSWIEMRLIADENLQRLLDRARPSRELLRVMSCMIVGLAIIHEAGIWHHDIHPGNILIYRGSPLYADFGDAHKFQEIGNIEAKNDGRGKASYQAQYLVPNFCSEHKKGEKADVLSLGGVLIQVLAILTQDPELKDLLPTIGFSWSEKLLEVELNEKVRTALEKLKPTDIRLPGYIGIVRGMLDPDTKSRPTAKEAALSA